MLVLLVVLLLLLLVLSVVVLVLLCELAWRDSLVEALIPDRLRTESGSCLFDLEAIDAAHVEHSGILSAKPSRRCKLAVWSSCGGGRLRRPNNKICVRTRTAEWAMAASLI